MGYSVLKTGRSPQGITVFRRFSETVEQKKMQQKSEKAKF
jgi:hypothetical protein